LEKKEEPSAKTRERKEERQQNLGEEAGRGKNVFQNPTVGRKKDPHYRE